jgi:hypothetical protein
MQLWWIEEQVLNQGFVMGADPELTSDIFRKLDYQLEYLVFD